MQCFGGNLDGFLLARFKPNGQQDDKFGDAGSSAHTTIIHFNPAEEDFATIAAHGFSDDDIWDIAAISAFFALSNRIANVTAMRPNDEFYLMGRLPK